mmetsp:Transcript_29649/g.44926  ORF Transcript_29649/g.44926 Transcript_29649/m.44926 type:complete len:98 (+) Transcript_29649:198-491(+)
MLRPNFHHGYSPGKKPAKAPHIMLNLIVMVAFALFCVKDEIMRLSTLGTGRKLLVQCIHNMYATSLQAAIDIPQPPKITTQTEVSSSMAICQVSNST